MSTFTALAAAKSGSTVGLEGVSGLSPPLLQAKKPMLNTKMKILYLMRDLIKFIV
jgi:hypothetical protein